MRRFQRFGQRPVSSNPEADVTKEHWFYAYWRPFMAWQYGIACAIDTVVLPVAAKLASPFYGKEFSWGFILVSEKHVSYHMAMGAIIGIYVWGRNQAHTEAIKQGAPPAAAPGVPPPPPPPAPINSPETATQPFRKTPV